MKIRFKGYLTLKQTMGDEPELMTHMGDWTIRRLLAELSVQFGMEFRKMVFDLETGEISSHIRVLVNGRHYAHIPDRLETRLKDGDDIAIFPPIAGG